MLQKGVSMATLDQKVRPHPEVVDTKLDDGEVALLHLGSKVYYSLNATGVRIWQGLKEGRTLKEISRLIQKEFDVDPNRADHSVINLVEELSQQELVQILEQ
jgi:hypothetical protein